MASKLIYQHIPKTGGSSLKKILESEYHRYQLLRIYDIENRQVNKNYHWYIDFYNNLNPVKRFFTRCIMGHSAGGFLGTNRNLQRAFALLRHPVDRVLSLYYYGLSLPDDVQYRFARIIKDRELSLPDIFNEYGKEQSQRSFDPFASFNEFFNGQIRAILRPKRHLLDWFRLAPNECDRAAEDEALQTALDLVEKHYVIGFQERFAESVNLFADEFGWKKDQYCRVNVTPERKSVAETPAELRQVIEEFNHLDIRFYEALYSRFPRHADSRGIIEQ